MLHYKTGTRVYHFKHTVWCYTRLLGRVVGLCDVSDADPFPFVIRLLAPTLTESSLPLISGVLQLCTSKWYKSGNSNSNFSFPSPKHENFHCTQQSSRASVVPYQLKTNEEWERPCSTVWNLLSSFILCPLPVSQSRFTSKELLCSCAVNNGKHCESDYDGHDHHDHDGDHHLHLVVLPPFLLLQLVGGLLKTFTLQKAKIRCSVMLVWNCLLWAVSRRSGQFWPKPSTTLQHLDLKAKM